MNYQLRARPVHRTYTAGQGRHSILKHDSSIDEKSLKPASNGRDAPKKVGSQVLTLALFTADFFKATALYRTTEWMVRAGKSIDAVAWNSARFATEIPTTDPWRSGEYSFALRRALYCNIDVNDWPRGGRGEGTHSFV